MTGSSVGEFVRRHRQYDMRREEDDYAVPRSGTKQKVRAIGCVALLILWLTVADAFAATFTVNSTGDASDATPGNGVCATAGAVCTLRAAIEESNAQATADLIDFSIPLTDGGYTAATGVFTINIGNPLPITRAGTVIDATTQAVNQSDTNPGMLGAGGRVGVGADGKPGTLDEPTLPQVAAPEIEIRDGAAVTIGLHIRADNVTIRGIAILGFGTANGDGAIVIDPDFTNTLIEKNVIGSGADAFTAPVAAGLRGVAGVDSTGGDNGIIQNNLIGFSSVRGVWLNNSSSGWTVSGNEFRDNGVLDTTDGDGISVSASSSNTFTGNLITGSTSQGYVVTEAVSTNNVFENNTVTGNGVGTSTAVTQSAGITFRGSTGATNNLLDRNLIVGNYGAGVQINNGASGIRMTRNSFADNGEVLPRGPGGATAQIGIDLNQPGEDANFGVSPFVTLNEAGNGAGGGNGILNYPILETATLAGGNLTLTGWSRPDAIIELFLANPDGSSFGEGETWVATFTEGVADADGDNTLYGSGAINGIAQGTDTTNRYSFTVPTPTGVVAGSILTATGTRVASNDTSEFSGLITVAGLPISGTVFEDVNYGGGVGRDTATAAGVARPGARVELYGGSGNYVTFTTTDGSGNYSFPDLVAGNHIVRVVNSTVTSSRPGYVAGLLPVQTFRTDADGGSVVAVTDQVGGQNPGVADAGNGGAGSIMNTTTGVFTAGISGTAQSITTVALGATSVTGIDFGYNFDTIVNTNDTGQGSLRQFILNSNQLTNAGLDQAGLTTGVETSLFMIPSDTDPWSRPQDANFDAARGVAVIAPTILLTAVDDADTAIDGTTQTRSVGDTNTVVLGTGGNVGVDGLGLPQVDGPEIEIVDTLGLTFGLDLQADDAVVRGIAIYGFGSGNANGNVRLGVDATSAYTGAIFEDNVIGSTADSFTDPDLAAPGTGTEGSNLLVFGADLGSVRRNLVGFAGRLGVYLNAGADDWTIEQNEIRRNGIDSDRLDGLSTSSSSTRTTIRRNLIADNQGAGVDFFASLGSHAVENNTLEDNGWGGVEPVGVRMFSNGSTIEKNLIRNQTGAGVLAVVDDPAFTETPAIRNRITQNRFSGNGSNAIDLQTTLDVVAPGDGITLNDGTLLGDSSVANVCGIVATDGNEGLDTPIVDLVLLGPVTSTVRGRACPGSEVEIYRAVADGDASDTLGGNDYGEGVEYLITTTAAAGTGLFDITTVPGLSAGDSVAAISIDGNNNTSEFSANVPVMPLKIVKRAFQADGTPIADGSTLPSGMPVRFLLYIDNTSIAVPDVSLQDVLDPLFAYQSGSMKVDNSLVSSVTCPGGVCDEAAIFAQVDGAGTVSGDGDSVSAPIDADVASYNSGTRTIDLGDRANTNNAQLNLAADRVWALVFTIQMQ